MNVRFHTAGPIRCDGNQTLCIGIIRAYEDVWNTGDRDLCVVCAMREPGTRIEVLQEKASPTEYDTEDGYIYTVPQECATCHRELDEGEFVYVESPGVDDVWCWEHKPLERTVGSVNRIGQDA